MSAANPNIAASVRTRLLNLAKAQGVDFTLRASPQSVAVSILQRCWSGRFSVPPKTGSGIGHATYY